MRLASIDQVYNTQAKKRVAAYSYNELGQLMRKSLGYTGSGYLQGVDYRYNIRGQLTNINNSKLGNDGGMTNSDTNDLFGMQVMYDNPDANISGAGASYSGRISAVKWMTVNGAVGTQTNERSYAYSYDKLERYTGSVYAERAAGSTSAFSANQHGFDESNISYDDNGNILSLKRNSSGIGATSYTTVDRLGYTYDGTKPNQLDAVTDTAANALGFYYKAGNTGSYSYDTEGNLLSDPYKGLSTKYSNILNKTDSITLTGAGMVTYTYDAGGSLLRKNTYNSSGTLTASLDYIGGFVYSSGTISYLGMPEGRVVNTGSALTAEYIITDQQGNARFSFQDNGSGAVKIIQENSYYAFGEVLAGSPVTTPTLPNHNLYNGGNEWQNEFGNLPDYHQTFYRNYDPEIGRFTGVDPMPESADFMTSYQYAGNDPVNGNDPMGDIRKMPSPAQLPQVSNYLDNTVLDQEEANNEAFMDGGDDSGDDGGGGGGSYGGAGGGGGDYSDFWNSAASFLNDIFDSTSDGETATLTASALYQGAALEQAITYDAQSISDLSDATNFSFTNGVLRWETQGGGADGGYGINLVSHSTTFHPNDNQGGYQTFNKTFYSNVGILYSPSFDEDEDHPGNSVSQVSSTSYYFRAEVSFQNISSNKYSFTAKLYYVGGAWMICILILVLIYRMKGTIFKIKNLLRVIKPILFLQMKLTSGVRVIL